MKKITQRIISSLSATVMFTSAIGSDTFIDSIIGVLRADSVGSTVAVVKYGSPDGFSNPEIDTRYDDKTGRKIYNTNYGLHTDKTVSKVYDDGRTFDLDLESWYIGENPVDVGLILDASGSMAWTTNALEPLNIDEQLSDEEKRILLDEYNSIASEPLTDFDTKKVLTALQNNEGYLPEKIVEMILDPENTDNTKLSYDNYHYYVYESRSAVAEFVPLGFWDGGYSFPDNDFLKDKDLIGYYPFNGTLNNEAPKAGNSATAKMISHAEDNGGVFGFGSNAQKSSAAVFTSDGYLDLSATDKKGNLVIDLSNKLDIKNEITISFTLNCADVGKQCAPQAPILYLGDGTNKHFVTLMRGRSHDTGNGAQNSVYVYDQNGQIDAYLNGNRIPKGDNDITNDNSIISSYGKDLNCTWTISFDAASSKYNMSLNAGGNTYTYQTDAVTLNTDKLYLIIGGNEVTPQGNLNNGGKEVIDPTDLKGIKIKDLIVNATTSEDESFGFHLPLTSEDKLTDENSGITAELKKQSPIDSTEFSFEEAVDSGDDSNRNAVYKNNALDLNATAKNGAVMLDAVPDDITKFTLSFKIQKTGKISDDKQNIFYIGDNAKTNYYQFFRSNANGGYMVLSRNSQTDALDDSSMYYQGGLKDNSVWYTNTLVFEPAGNGKVKVTPYIDGKKEYQDGSKLNKPVMDSIVVDKSEIALIIGALKSSATGSEHYIDDVCVFNKALTADEVSNYFGDINTAIDTTGNCTTTTTSNSKTTPNHHIGFVEEESSIYEFAQIKDGLFNNAPVDRRGWYYVNSHSAWDDITGCLGGGKQYLGVINDTYGDAVWADTATIPSSYTGNEVTRITDGDTDKILTYNGSERSIRFYVDSVGNLRCIFNSGQESKDLADNQRTFCSVVYYREPSKKPLKYQTLNDALNYFNRELQKLSSLSNISAVRFSSDNVKENVDDLILLNWGNKSDTKAGSEFYGQGLTNLENPRFGDSSVNVNEKSEHNYVLTGGTYTYSGFQAFNKMNEIYPLQNPNKRKYIILFTDGRDNKVEYQEADPGYKYSPTTPNNPDGISAIDLADQLRAEGYTIYCVMLSTGSVSPNNASTKDTFNSAKSFLTAIAKNEDRVKVASPEDEDGALEEKFEEILNEINESLHGYVVQDYIDPRFDLIDKKGVVYHLGAGGKITYGDKSVTVENAIGNASANGLPYIPKNYNAKTESEEDKSKKQEAKIYYDDLKDMYYLRWVDQEIDGGSFPFDTDTDNIVLDGDWSATITIKAKDDFIGGNAITTNGNEAGMNLVFTKDSIDYKNDNVRDKLASFSGTDKSQDIINGVRQDYNPAKGFPRTTVNVRLLPINTKNLDDVIYLGEVVSPTMMLADIEDGYMTGSYYLEYLGRYAYRLYGDNSDNTPLIDLLNEWLRITDRNITIKKFTIPYIYLPAPEYTADNKIKKDASGKAVLQNNTGKDMGSGFDDPNLQDIVGFITYSWEKVGEPEPEQNNDITKEFVVKTTNQIKYTLKLEFTPMHERINGYSFGKTNFINKDVFFNAVDDEFVSSNSWIYGTRPEYIKAFVTDTAYKWNSGYKPTNNHPMLPKLNEQIEDGRNYGDATYENYSLVAKTTYTKDVVNGALALELIVKGEHLSGGKITQGKTLTFTAERNYKDELDPLPYGDKSSQGANANNEQYSLTFTVGKLPSNTKNDEYYTIWAKLTEVKTGNGDPTKFGGHFLPIGTYTITPNLAKEDQFIVKDSTRFTNLNTDISKASYKYDRFPDNVTKETHTRTDNEYTIWDDVKKMDRSDENIANTAEETNSVKFYLGTDKLNSKGISKKKVPTTTEEYVKDRLGIIMLSYDEGNLSISKEVTNTSDENILDKKWTFKVELKLPAGSEMTYDLKWYELKNGKYEENKVRNPKTITFNGPVKGVYTAEIEIKHNEKVTIQQLPINAVYTVSEIFEDQNDDNFKTFIDGKEGLTADGSVTPASSVHCVNEFPAYEMPETGGTGTIIFTQIGLICMVAGLALFLICRRVESKKNREQFL